MNQDTNQLTLSYELLYLMQWLIENEPEKLKTLIGQSFNNGLKEELKTIAPLSEQHSMEDLQYNIIDFLGMLETLLQEVSNEHALKRVMEKKLMPALDHIDTTNCDNETVQSSVEKASSKIDSNPERNPQELLFKELLRSWKPDKKTTSN